MRPELRNLSRYRLVQLHQVTHTTPIFFPSCWIAAHGGAAQTASSLYLFGAVCPARDEAVALVLPDVSTAAMQAMLDELSKAVEQDAHAVVVMDRAGWHCAKALNAPNNLSLAFLPSYSPELNVIERALLYLKERHLSLRVWPDYDDILDAVCKAWNKLLDEPGRINSLTNADWIPSIKN